LPSSLGLYGVRIGTISTKFPGSIDKILNKQ